MSGIEWRHVGWYWPGEPEDVARHERALQTISDLCHGGWVEAASAVLEHLHMPGTEPVYQGYFRDTRVTPNLSAKGVWGVRQWCGLDEVGDTVVTTMAIVRAVAQMEPGNAPLTGALAPHQSNWDRACMEAAFLTASEEVLETRTFWSELMARGRAPSPSGADSC